MIKAVTFDLFDTLAPAAEFDRKRQQALYTFVNEKVCSVSFERFREVERQHMARRFEKICRTLEEVVYNDRFPLLFRELSGREPELSLVDEASALTCEAMAGAIRVPPYVPELLDQLSKNYKLALISNFPVSRPVHEGLERAGIRRFFDVIIVSSDFGLAKPHPSIFREAARQLGVELFETAHAGDDWACDVLGAANVGSLPIYVTQFKDEEKIRLSGDGENMRLLCSHMNVGPELDNFVQLDDIRNLEDVLI